MIERRLPTTSETAEYIGRTEEALRKLVYRREIPFVKLGRTVRFDVRDLDGWINKHKVKAERD